MDDFLERIKDEVDFGVLDVDEIDLCLEDTAKLSWYDFEEGK